MSLSPHTLGDCLQHTRASPALGAEEPPQSPWTLWTTCGAAMGCLVAASRAASHKKWRHQTQIILRCHCWGARFSTVPLPARACQAWHLAPLQGRAMLQHRKLRQLPGSGHSWRCGGAMLLPQLACRRRLDRLACCCRRLRAVLVAVATAAAVNCHSAAQQEQARLPQQQRPRAQPGLC